MQNSTLVSFLKNIENIREYVKHIKLINQIENSYRTSTDRPLEEFVTHFKIFHKEKKLFEHKAIFISLYGLLENSITNWIKEHVDNVSQLVGSYQNLSEEFKKKHFDLSIKLIPMIKENSKYEYIEREVILKKLNFSITEPSKCDLNSEAYIPMSGNLKHSKIVEALMPLDIELDKKLTSNIKHIFTKIDNLVSMRNDIAHGNIIDNRLDITEFDEFIDSLEEYGKAIFSVFEEKEIEYESNNLYKKIDLNDIVGVHRNYNLEFNIDDHILKVGDFLIVKDANGNFIKTEILDIDVRDKSYDHLHIVSQTNVYLTLKNKIKRNMEFYIKTNQNASVHCTYPLMIIQ